MSAEQVFCLQGLGIFMLLGTLLMWLLHIRAKRRSQVLPPPCAMATRSYHVGCAGVFEHQGRVGAR